MKSSANRVLYVLFYLLFSPDTWRILIGFAAAVVVGPGLTAGNSYSPTGQAVIWLMILALGYVLSAPIGRFIAGHLTAAFRRRTPGVLNNKKKQK